MKLTESELNRIIELYGSKKQAVLALERQQKGVIEVCPRCGKVDIFLPNHAESCSPFYEQQKRYNDEYLF